MGRPEACYEKSLHVDYQRQLKQAVNPDILRESATKHGTKKQIGETRVIDAKINYLPKPTFGRTSQPPKSTTVLSRGSRERQENVYLSSTNHTSSRIAPGSNMNREKLKTSDDLKHNLNQLKVKAKDMNASRGRS